MQLRSRTIQSTSGNIKVETPSKDPITTRFMANLHQLMDNLEFVSAPDESPREYSIRKIQKVVKIYQYMNVNLTEMRGKTAIIFQSALDNGVRMLLDMATKFKEFAKTAPITDYERKVEQEAYITILSVCAKIREISKSS